jgi:hypothetical protein
MNQHELQLSEQAVFDYLAEHPDFLERHPRLLTHLQFSHEVEGGVSLVERQVKVLREKNRELQGRLIDMLSAAQTNEQLLSKCIRLTLCLIDCQSLAQMVNTLHDVLRREFGLKEVSISLVGRWPRVNDARIYADADRLFKPLECEFPDNEPVCGRLDRKTKELLFSSYSGSQGSVALIPLGQKGRLGLLALLSDDPAHFSPDMGSLFLELIAAVTTQMLTKFKDF